MGSHDGEAAIARYFAHRLRAVVVSVGYRKAPEHAWPASIDDAEDVARVLLDAADAGSEVARGGVPLVVPPFDREKVLLVGMSAGGYHAIQLALVLAAAGVRVAGHVAIAPMVSPLMCGGSLARNEATSLFPVRTILWAWAQYLRDAPPHTWDWRVSGLLATDAQLRAVSPGI
eukprot:5503919-Prymnesium_polylepis.1